MGVLLLAGLGAVVGYQADVDGAALRWAVHAPGLAEGRFARPLPEGAALAGAEARRDARGRVVAVHGAAPLRFTVTVPRAGDWVRPPLLAGPVLHRVLVQGPPLDFADVPLRAGIRYRAGAGVDGADRARADRVLGQPGLGAAPIYVAGASTLGARGAVARWAADGGRGAVWVVVGGFAAVLMVMGTLYRRLARRARWERTQVKLEQIAGDEV